jgi:type I restriction enzyme M protein
VECVLGLGPSLFYNSPMEACIVICRTRKPKSRKGRTLFIDAVHDIDREKTQSFLRAEHQARILRAYQAFDNEPEFAHVATKDEILAQGGDLTVHHYVTRKRISINKQSGLGSGSEAGTAESITAAWTRFDDDGRQFWTGIDALVEMLDDVVAEKVGDV